MNYIYDPERLLMKDGDDLSTRFFSKENVDIIQSLIQNMVYVSSKNNFRISRQSDTELFIVMKSIYTQYGMYNQSHIDKQIKELNVTVAKECTRIIIPAIEQYVVYSNKIDNHGLNVLSHGTSTSQKGMHNENNYSNLLY